MKKFLLKNKWIVFSVLGLINALPFTFEFLFFISWFTFAPFFAATVKLCDGKTSSKKLFAYIFLFFLFFHAGIYHFFFALIPMTFVGLGYISSFLLMLLAWIVLSAIHALGISVAFFAVSKARINNTFKIIAFALVVVLIQYLQSIGTYGFTWARVSLPQSAWLPMIQSASLFGPYFLDLLLLTVNAFIAIAFITNRVTLFGGLAVLVLSANYLYGFFYMRSEIKTQNEKNVSIVQGNVLMDEKWGGNSSYSVYLRETLTLADTDSLVVWTETAVPTDLNDSKKIIGQLEAYTVSSGNDMIVGAFYCSPMGMEQNGAYYISDGKLSDNVYFKRRLVPFGEFLPFRKVLSHVPILGDINLLPFDLFPGHGTYVTETDEGNIGCLICFDSIFPYLSRESVYDGAELLVIITNDAWYKDYPAVYQHNNQAIWRAVENGRYVVRAANSGISAFITPNGEIVSSLPPLVKGTITEKMYFISDKTLYTRIGDVIIIPIIAILLIYTFISIKRRFSEL